MSIFSRFSQVLKSNVNSMLDAAEDPDKMIGQHIHDMETELKKAKGELLTTLGTVKRLEKKREEILGEAKSWEDKAVLALRNGDETLAREALRWKNKSEKEAADLSTQAAAQATAGDQMKATLEKIEAKIEEMKNRKGTLAAQIRQSRSTSPTSAAETPGSAFGELQRMTDKLEQYEAEVEAHAVLDDTRRAEVEAKFRELERSGASPVAGGGVDDQLAALKRKLEGK